MYIVQEEKGVGMTVSYNGISLTQYAWKDIQKCSELMCSYLIYLNLH